MHHDDIASTDVGCRETMGQGIYAAGDLRPGQKDPSVIVGFTAKAKAQPMLTVVCNRRETGENVLEGRSFAHGMSV
jgi:hypothetical protein